MRKSFQAPGCAQTGCIFINSLAWHDSYRCALLNLLKYSSAGKANVLPITVIAGVCEMSHLWLQVSEPNFLKWSLNTLPFFFTNFIIANALWLCCCNNGFLRGRHLEIRRKKKKCSSVIRLLSKKIKDQFMFDGWNVWSLLSIWPLMKSNTETGSLSVHMLSISQQGHAVCQGGNKRINTPRHTQLGLFLNSVPIEQHLLSSPTTPTSKSPTSLSARKAFGLNVLNSWFKQEEEWNCNV